jgi:hypothetical protein
LSNHETAAGLVQQGTAAFKAGDTQAAAKLLYQATKADPNNQLAWLWLSGCFEDDKDKRTCLERARDINPQSDLGQRAAAALNKMPVLKEAAPAEPRSAASQPVAPSSNQHTPAKAPAKRKKRGKAASVASALILGVILLCVGIGVVMWLFEPSATALSTGDQSSTQAASTTPDLCANVRSSDLVRTEYDRFDQSTTVKISTGIEEQEPIKLHDADATWILLGARFMHDGRTIRQPEALIGFTVSSISHEWQFLRSRDLIVIADGKRLRFGEMTLHNTSVTGSFVGEDMNIIMSREEFMDIAFARNVEMQIGNKEFRVSSQVHQAYRDIACRMVP